MVGKLLDMARLQSGRLSLRKEWQAIDEVIGVSIQSLGEALREHPVRVALAPNLPLVAVDAVLMERVFCNLLENAAKYSPAGAPIAVQVDADAGALAVEVRDRGEGFPPSCLTHVFELFQRGNPESAVAGVGLGLAICRAIVDAHGGQIIASNPPGGGGCVHFTIPCGEPPRIEPELADPAEVQP
jgi:two-component system sensor histidine kinase KdpD